MINTMKKDLEFSVPRMHLNMRNSREITQVGKTVKSESGGRKITKIIDYLEVWKSSITSYLPTIFPVTEAALNEDYSKVIKHVTENGKVNIILFSDESNFDVSKMKDALLECGVEEEDIFVHKFDSNNTKQDIKDFICKNRGVLICQDDLFTGMEAKWLLYCISDRDYEKNIRVNIMRACEKLHVLYQYKEDDDAFISFMSARMDPTFLKECDQEMVQCVWKCHTCQNISKHNRDTDKREEDFMFCKTCFVGCHIGHEMERKSVVYDLQRQRVQCQCKKNYPCCLFRLREINRTESITTTSNNNRRNRCILS